MPLGVQGHDRVFRDRITTSRTAGCEQLFKVRPAVGMPVPLVEGGAHQRLLAGSVAHEALLVPRLLHGLDGALFKEPFIRNNITRNNHNHNK